MTPQSTTSTRLVRTDPSSLYESPYALAIDGALSREERVQLLRQWDQDVREKLVASGEGMSRSETPTAGDPSLSEIAVAMEEVSGPGSERAETPTQHGAPLADPGGEAGKGAESTSPHFLPSEEFPIAEDILIGAVDAPRRGVNVLLIPLAVLLAGVEIFALSVGAPLWATLPGAAALLFVLSRFRSRPDLRE